MLFVKINSSRVIKQTKGGDFHFINMKLKVRVCLIAKYRYKFFRLLLQVAYLSFVQF